MVASSNRHQRFVASLITGARARAIVSIAALLAVLSHLSCAGSAEDDPEPGPRLGRVAQALDTDGDSMDDAWETTYFGNLSQTGSGDFDSDGMTNLEEYLGGFNPTVDDAFDDADGDRYPNVFELRNSADPNSSSSVPTPTYVVNGAGGGTHTTISAALSAANVVNGAYQIIAIAAGTYTGGANLRNVTVTSSKPKILFIGLEGAAKTTIDGTGLPDYGWLIQNAAVVSSLTFRKINVAVGIDSTTKEIRLVDLIVRDNVGLSNIAGGVHCSSAANVHIIGSTFFNNTGMSGGNQIWFGGSGRLVNTAVVGRRAGRSRTPAARR